MKALSHADREYRHCDPLQRTEKINREAPTLAETIKIADEIPTAGGKAAMIYPVAPEKFTVFVPNDMIAASRAAMVREGISGFHAPT